jgi:penicillin-binding protein 2
MKKSRLIAAYLFIIITFSSLFLRYGYLQLINHTQLLQQSVNNYSSIVSTIPVRGQIVDRNGVILAENNSSYVLAALPKDLKGNQEQLFESLSKYVNITALDKKKYYASKHNSKNYDWVTLKDDLSDTEIANLTAHSYEFPQLAVFARIKRYYPFDEIYSHSIGYVGRMSQKDKQKITGQNYLSNDYIGKSGLEQSYEKNLRGTLGKKSIKTDANGNEINLMNNIAAIDGNTLHITIDNNLQKLAWNLLGDNKGAVVAIDPTTGGILAFVSKPGYDPNWFIDGISLDDWSDLTSDPKKPLINRASQGTYPPGSTFKPFLALSALFLGVRTPKSTMYDPGYYVIPGSSHRFRDSEKHARGTIDLMDAITFSSDTYFYKLGLDMGIDRAYKTMSMFGFGKKTGVDLPVEASGLLPSREWKARRFSHDDYQKTWQAADSVNFGIGQGFNNYTPLQMAFAATIIANEGLVITPHFFASTTDKNGIVIESHIINSHQLPIKNTDFQFVKLAMQNVVLKGTAHGISAGLKYTMAGKTGTAQVVAMNKGDRHAKFQGKQYKDHSWFIAFAPVDKPKIAIAVLVENGGFGAAAAAPIARQVFDYYLLGPPNPAAANEQYKKLIQESVSNTSQNNMDDNNDTAEESD